LLKILVAFGITGATVFVLDKKGLKLPESLVPIAIALFVGGVLFSSQRMRRKRAARY